MQRPQLLFLGLLSLRAISLAAAPFGPQVLLTSTHPSKAALAYTTDGVLAAWIDQGVVRVKATDLAGDGYVIGEGALGVAIAAIGERGIVAWTEGSGAVRAMGVTDEGVPFGVAMTIGDEAAGSVAVAASGDRYLVVWDTTIEEVRAALLDRSISIRAPAMTLAFVSGGDTGEVVAASNGSDFAVAWHTWAPASQVLAIIVSGAGFPQTFEPIVVADHAFYPDITSDGTNYLIAWGDTRSQGIRGRTMASTYNYELGRVIKFTSSEDVVPNIAWDGSAYSMAFIRVAHPRPGFAIPFLTAYRFRESGAVVENLGASAPLFAQGYVLDARAGRVDLLVPGSNGLTLQTAFVEAPAHRSRAVRR